MESSLAYDFPARICLGRTPPETCVYLPDRRTTLSVVSPLAPDERALDVLLARGHRRSGSMFYVPVCSGCRECVPLRVPIDSFAPSRGQRRIERKTGPAVAVRVEEPVFRRDCFELYLRHARHVSDRAPVCDEENYRLFLVDSGVPSVHVLYHDVGSGDLLGFGVLDVGREAASSVYFCWEPSAAALSLGTYSVLWEIAWCRARSIRYYYLGYRVGGCRSMAYKARFRPHERMDWKTGTWEETL